MFDITYEIIWGLLRQALVVKKPPGNAGEVRIVSSINGLERSLGEGNGNTIQNILQGEIPWTEEPGKLSLCPWGSKKVRCD